MANRIMLNETSYHGAGAIGEIATEAKARAYKKDSTGKKVFGAYGKSKKVKIRK